MNQSFKIEVLYRDEALLVVNKPAGLASLPDGYNPSLPHIKSVLEQEAGALWMVHRLDKETSGVLILARSAQAHRSLNTQFEHHEIRKVYHAMVQGNPAWQEQTVRLPLRPNGDRHHRTVVDPEKGKPAVTHFRVLERYEAYCLVEAIPETGRTHQIRAHLNALGLSIVGDRLYGRSIVPQDGHVEQHARPGNDSPIPLRGRMGLHALSLEITHPLSGAKMIFSASYPAEMKEALEKLRSKSIRDA